MILNSTLQRCLISSVFFMLSIVHANSQAPRLIYTQVVGGLDFPVDVVNAGDGSGRLFIVQQNGVIRLYKNNTLSTFINISSVISFNNDERGLLSLAFHPDYDGINNRYFYVYYTFTNTSNITQIKVARYQTMIGNPDVGDPASGNEVISIDKPVGFANHNGGKLNFGADGMLYFGTGDGGSANDPFNNAQNGLSLLGKMIRIDINGSTVPTPFYSIPPDNPYLLAADPTDQVRDEIWQLGLRNPFRWSFDPVTGAMYIGDVGQSSWEEIDVRMPSPTTGGINWGWRCYEADQNPPLGIPACNPLPANYVGPTYVYGHNNATGGFSVTGGMVYRGTGSPLLVGYYVFSDYVSGNVWVMSPSNVITQQPDDLAGVAGFGVDENGELFGASRGNGLGQGRLMQVTSSVILPVRLLNFNGTARGTYNELHWTSSDNGQAEKFFIEYSSDGIHFQTAGETPATNNPLNETYSFNHVISSTGRIYYRLQIRNRDGSTSYSVVIVLGNRDQSNIKIYPTIVTDRTIQVNSSSAIDKFTITDIAGRVVYTDNTSGRQGFFTIQIPALTKGVYLVNVLSNRSIQSQKIMVQ